MKPDIADIINSLKQELAEDGNYMDGNIFSSMSSFPDEDAKTIFIEFIEKNAGDPSIFGGTKKVEKKLIEILGNLFHNKTPYGNVVSGGSEANLVGLWAARNYYRKIKNLHRERLNIIIPETRHTSIDKAADILDLEKIIIPVNQNYEINTKVVEEEVNEKTCAILGIAGNTVFGAIDEIGTLSKIALDNNTWLHVDAAFGGFVIPFIDNSPSFDFALEGVKSLGVDGHKMLSCPIPNGNIIFKSREFSEEITHHIPYFTGIKTENRTITGTKSGASVIAEYFLLKWKGFSWLKERAKKAILNSKYLKEQLIKREFEIVGKANLNIFATIVPEHIKDKYFNIHKSGWKIGKFQEFWRFVVQPNHEITDIDRLLDRIDSEKI